MASNFSFDIVSEIDRAAMNNAIESAQREIANRYDFKNTPAAIGWLDAGKGGVKIIGASDFQVEQILDILRKNLAKFELTTKFLDLDKPLATNNMQTTKEIPFIEGLDQEKAKTVTKLIRDNFSKAKPQIQGDMVRVTSSSKDELQNVMKLLRESDLDFAVNFANFR